MDDTILKKIEQEEKRRKRRMYWYSLIPIIITAILVAVSYAEVNSAQQKVEDAQMKVDTLENRVQTLGEELKQKNDSLKILEESFEFAVNYKDKRFEMGYAADKEMYSVYPRQTQMLTEVRHLIEEDAVKWKLGGSSLEEGFDSPSFATYLINKFSSTQIPKDKTYRLDDYLTKVQQPRVGDLVIYETGYSMIYFRSRGKPFVIGMTPVGLASLQLDFGPRRIGYYRVEY